MASTGRAILYGVSIWIGVFVVAMAVFPFREANRPLFESVVTIGLATTAAFFAHAYFARIDADFVREGILLGIVWAAMNVLVDVPMVLFGPLEMTAAEYAADIGITYLLIPVITISVGMASARVAHRKA